MLIELFCKLKPFQSEICKPIWFCNQPIFASLYLHFQTDYFHLNYLHFEIFPFASFLMFCFVNLSTTIFLAIFSLLPSLYGLQFLDFDLWGPPIFLT